MAVPVFIVEPGAPIGRDTRVVVTGPEGRHAVSVARLRVGERVDLVDGLGVRAHAVVRDVRKPDHLEVDVESVVSEAQRSPRVTVVQALPKGDRAERAVEVLTEVGVDRIIPWAAARCVTQWKDSRGRDKWIVTAREASKQSRRSRFPEVAELASLGDVVSIIGAGVTTYILDEFGSQSIDSVHVPVEGEIVLVVGPEGGIAPDELEAMTAAGGIATRLGPTVLRTSTAGVVAAGVVLARSGRWQDLAP